MSYVLINNLSTQMNVSKPRKRVKQTTLLTKVTNKVVLLKEDLQDLMQKNQELTERNNTLEEENKSYIKHARSGGGQFTHVRVFEAVFWHSI